MYRAVIFSPHEADSRIPFEQDLTPGKKLEAKLNTEYGGDSEFYQTLERLAFRGLNDVSTLIGQERPADSS